MLEKIFVKNYTKLTEIDIDREIIDIIITIKDDKALIFITFQIQVQMDSI